MNGYNPNPCRTFLATAALTAFRAVSIVASTGYVQHAGAGDTPVGTTEATGASSTAARAVQVRLFSSPGTRTMVAGAAISQFAIVYVTANGKITSTPNGVSIGVAMEAATADGDEIEVLTGCESLFSQGIIYKALANSADHHTSSSETVLASASLPANSLKAGDSFEVWGVVWVNSVTSTPTLRARVRVGGTTLTGSVLADTGTISVIADNWLMVRARFTVRTIGGSGTMVGHGSSNSIATSTHASQSAALESTTIDTTAAVLVEMTGVWSASSASNSCYALDFGVRKN